MNRMTIIAAGTVALTATSAAAYTGVSPSILESAENIAAEAGLTIDVTELSDEQVIEIYAAGQAGDDGERVQRVKAAVEGTGALAGTTERRLVLVDPDAETGLMPAGQENSIVMSVQNILDRRGFEVDASTLSDSQVAEIYMLAFGGDTEPQNGQIEVILNM